MSEPKRIDRTPVVMHDSACGVNHDGPCGGCRCNCGADAVNTALASLRSERDAATARAEAAESECAELNDALDAARMVIDEVQARQRGRVQAGAWAQAAAAVQAASPKARAR